MKRLDGIQKARLLDLLTRLVVIESINRDPQSARQARAEERIAGFMVEHLRSMGMEVEAREFEPGRPNLIAHWPDQGRDAAKSLMFNAHMDTVTVDGMIVDPFKVEVREGKAYGRGTCDTKGSLACFLTALAIARSDGTLPLDKIYFVATVAEESCCQGAAALMQTGFRADAAIVGEATRCRVVTSHKGPLWLTVETRGRACHASMPERGVNAVERMAQVVQFVHGSEWQGRIQRTSHPLLGRSTMSVTTIEGGQKINIIPDRCRAQIDGRFIPEESTEQVAADFRRMLARHLGGSGTFEIVHQETQAPLNCPPDAPLPSRLMEVCREFNGQAEPLGVNYFADTGPFDQAGIQSILFGPGDIAQAHTVDEYIELDQLHQATEILLTFLARHAGRSILTP